MGDEFNFNDSDDESEDFIRKEEREIQEQIRKLVKKIAGDDTDVSNSDLIQYLRIINYNFATLYKNVQTSHYRLTVLEELLESLNNKLNSFVESTNLIDEALDESDSEEI